jgi:hypothetical protein
MLLRLGIDVACRAAHQVSLADERGRFLCVPEIATHPCMDRLTGDPDRAATSVTEAPANTARTASNRCSTADNTTSTNPGLRPTTSAEHRRPEGRTRDGVSSCYWHATVKHLPEQDTLAHGAFGRSFLAGSRRRLRRRTPLRGDPALRAALARRPRAPHRASLSPQTFAYLPVGSSRHSAGLHAEPGAST